MFETDPVTMTTVATDAAQTVLQAGPPADLPAAVPDFVSDILDTVRNSAGEGGIGDQISELIPGGTEADGNAAAGAGAENASN